MLGVRLKAKSSESRLGTTRGHHQRFLQLPTRVDAYMNSFFPFTIKLWNQLDDHIIQAPSLDLFNNYINL